MLAIIKIPEHGLSVLATGGTQGTVRRHGDGVQVTTVSNVVGLELAVGQVPDLTSKTKKLSKKILKNKFERPYLDVFVPTARDNDGVLVVRGEPDARHPFGVTFFLDSVLALGQGVPQLDGLVPGSGDNLTIVGGESDTQNIVVVVLEAASGASSRQIPQAQVLVPGSGQGKVTIGGQNDIGDEVSMTMETLLRNAVLLVIAGQLPNDKRLVP